MLSNLRYAALQFVNSKYPRQCIPVNSLPSSKTQGRRQHSSVSSTQLLSSEDFNDDSLPFILSSIDDVVARQGLSHDHDINCISVNIIAYSGGVDSTLVASLVRRVFPLNTVAVLGISASLSIEQQSRAVSAASHPSLNIPLLAAITDEGSHPDYIRNDGTACYVCKSHLYSALNSIGIHMSDIVNERQFSKESWNSDGIPILSKQTLCGELMLASSNKAYSAKLQEALNNGSKIRAVLFNGTNADDINDISRVGLVAAKEWAVKSPLATAIRVNSPMINVELPSGVPKWLVRKLALHLKLPNSKWAASPCLRSRLQLGVAATKSRLEKVAAAERVVLNMFLKTIEDDLNMGPLHPDNGLNLRVRHLSGGIASVEIDSNILSLLQLPLSGFQLKSEDIAIDVSDRVNSKIHRALSAMYAALIEIGYNGVELRPFRSGGKSTHPPPI